MYLLQQLVCNLRKQAVHVITILGGSLEQDNIIYTTKQCSVGVTLAVSPGGNTSRACWRTPPPRLRGSRGRRGLSCYPPAPAAPAHTRAQYHGPIRVEGYKAATNESSPWGWRTPRSPAASPGSSRRWAGWSRRTRGSGRGRTGSRTAVH